MFGKLYKVIDNVQQLSVNALFFQVVKDPDVSRLILQLNRIEQLFKKGVDSEGKIFGVYSEFTEFINEGKSFAFGGESKQKLAGEPYLLFDSGDFYRSFVVRVFRDGYFVIYANDEKRDGTELARKFGDKILGLTDESKTDLAEFIKPEIVKETRRKILE